MSQSHHPSADEVDHLLRNAELRNALEPFFDESLVTVDTRRLPTPVENEFLASMLAWERAPVLPIAQWFEPELRLPAPESLDESQLHRVLWETIQRLFEKRIVLDFTDHLSDRQLYCLIYRDILPSPEKKIDHPDNYLHWDCAGADDDPTVYLRFFASDEERRAWEEETGETAPQREKPPFPRRLPRRPL